MGCVLCCWWCFVGGVVGLVGGMDDVLVYLGIVGFGGGFL